MTSADDPTTHAAVAAAREAHVRRFLGEDFTVLHERSSAGITLDVLVFAPTQERPYVTLVTSGMSDVPMTMPPGRPPLRQELMIALPAAWGMPEPLRTGTSSDDIHFWMLDLLKDTARIPTTYDTFIGWGHSIVNASETTGQPEPYDPHLPFVGALIGPPLGYPPQIMRAQTPVGEIDYLAIYPLTQEELDFKQAVPDGADHLIDLFSVKRLGAVLDPKRDRLVDGAPAWSVHVLMGQRPADVGTVLDHYLPETAAVLSEQGDQSFLMPTDSAAVTWRVAGPIASEALFADAAASAEGPGLAIPQHRGTVSLTPERGAPDDVFALAMAMTQVLSERDDVIAVWLPEQHHVTSAKTLAREVDGDRMVTFRPRPTADGQGVETVGFAALGGREVRFADSAGAQTLHDALNTMSSRNGPLPSAGQRSRKVNGTRYELRDAIDPLTGEQFLELVAEEGSGGRGLFRRKS